MKEGEKSCIKGGKLHKPKSCSGKTERMREKVGGEEGTYKGTREKGSRKFCPGVRGYIGR